MLAARVSASLPSAPFIAFKMNELKGNVVEKRLKLAESQTFKEDRA